MVLPDWCDLHVREVVFCKKKNHYILSKWQMGDHCFWLYEPIFWTFCYICYSGGGFLSTSGDFCCSRKERKKVTDVVMEGHEDIHINVTVNQKSPPEVKINSYLLKTGTKKVLPTLKIQNKTKTIGLDIMMPVCFLCEGVCGFMNLYLCVSLQRCHSTLLWTSTTLTSPGKACDPILGQAPWKTLWC